MTRQWHIYAIEIYNSVDRDPAAIIVSEMQKHV